MTARRPAHGARDGVSLAFVAMCFVQLGVAASVGLFDQLGAEGTAWLRLVWAGAILVLVARPWRATWSRPGSLTSVVLGVATAGMTMLFMAAVARLPLGIASALEFVGPLSVAIGRGGTIARRWAVLAGAGVLLLTEPWQGHADLVGVALALGAAACWATYIMLTQRAGDELTGLRALTISMPVAAVVATITVGPTVFGRLTWQLAVLGFALALLLPVIPFSLELLALRRLTTAAFGTLMSLEPAIALVVGLIILGQVPKIGASCGIALVVAASVGTQRTGARRATVSRSYVEAVPASAASGRDWCQSVSS